MPKRIMYMHTINGRPARYIAGEQIYFINFYGKFIGKLVSSLRQIRKEQRASDDYRNRRGWKIERDCGYIRVELPSLKVDMNLIRRVRI